MLLWQDRKDTWCSCFKQAACVQRNGCSGKRLPGTSIVTPIGVYTHGSYSGSCQKGNFR
ncbi:MAG TPA: hypothetical protein VIG72_02125 [Pontibacter sp.]